MLHFRNSSHDEPKQIEPPSVSFWSQVLDFFVLETRIWCHHDSNCSFFKFWLREVLTLYNDLELWSFDLFLGPPSFTRKGHMSGCLQSAEHHPLEQPGSCVPLLQCWGLEHMALTTLWSCQFIHHTDLHGSVELKRLTFLGKKPLFFFFVELCPICPFLMQFHHLIQRGAVLFFSGNFFLELMLLPSAVTITQFLQEADTSHSKTYFGQAKMVPLIACQWIVMGQHHLMRIHAEKGIPRLTVGLNVTLLTY